MKIDNTHSKNSGKNLKPEFLWSVISRGSEYFGVACYDHQSMEESHRRSRQSLVLECLSIQRIQTHLQTVICISEVTDWYFLLLIKN